MKTIAIIALITGISALTPVAAQAPADSAKVYFRLGHRQYEPAFNGNDAGMQPFLQEVRRHDAAANIEHLQVRSYASPDGSNAANQRLSENRCKTITAYILAETGISPTLIRTDAEGIAWDELRRMVAADNRVPHREEVLEVLDNTPLWVTDSKGIVVGGRKKALMDLRGGVPYRWLYTNIFPDLRNAVAVSLYVKTPEPETAPQAEPVQPAPAPAPAEEIAETATAAETIEPVGPTTPEPTPEVAPLTDSTAPHTPWHRLAVKTNLIYDALLMPSLELEYRFNRRWTLNAEADVAWWKNDSRHKYYQVMMLSPEARYWFKNHSDNPWHGHYVGAFAGGGKYDLENGNRGYLGEGYFAGISYGFMFPIARNLSLEAGIGVGYLYTRYKEYLPIDGHYLYQRTRSANYFGPLKLKFTFVWRLWDVSKNNAKKGADL